MGNQIIKYTRQSLKKISEMHLLVHVDVGPLWYRPLCSADAEAEIRLQCCEFTLRAHREVRGQTANGEYTACASFFNILPLRSVVFLLTTDAGSRIKRHANQRGQGTHHTYISVFRRSRAFANLRKTPPITASLSPGVCMEETHSGRDTVIYQRTRRAEPLTLASRRAEPQREAFPRGV